MKFFKKINLKNIVKAKTNSIYRICIQQKRKEKCRNCIWNFILVPHTIRGGLILKDGLRFSLLDGLVCLILQICGYYNLANSTSMIEYLPKSLYL